jgi:hypothetical protein
VSSAIPEKHDVWTDKGVSGALFLWTLSLSEQRKCRFFDREIINKTGLSTAWVVTISFKDTIFLFYNTGEIQ